MKSKKIIALFITIALLLSNVTTLTASSKENTSQGENLLTIEEEQAEVDESVSEEEIEASKKAEEAEEKLLNAKSTRATTKATAAFTVASYSYKGVKSNIKTYTSYSSAVSGFNSYYNSYIKSNKEKAYGLVILNSAGKIINMKSGIVVSGGHISGSATLTFSNTHGEQSAYVSSYDVMHYGGTTSYTTATNSKVKVTVSGHTNYAPVSKLILIPRTLIAPYGKGNFANRYKLDYYKKNSSGDLVHYIQNLTDPKPSQQFESGEKTWEASFVVDKAPSFMKTGTKYYSRDGVNFYTSQFLTSTSKVGTYYPYFKYLSYRTKTTYSTAQMNKYINASAGSSSKLYKQGSNLIAAQNAYGVNALMELSFANLESAYGKSWYAKNRNNLFGIAAYDSNPDNAYSFSSVKSCINQHAYRYISRGYLDAKTDSRYFGAAPGNKNFGITVKYASDPYHGEKIAGLTYTADKYLGKKDYRRYTLGITTKVATVYKTASTKTKLYKMSPKEANSPTGLPVIILGTSGNYYMIQSDMPVVGSKADCTAKYNYKSSIAYVKKSDIKIISKGKVTYNSLYKPAPVVATKLSFTKSTTFSPKLSNIYKPRQNGSKTLSAKAGVKTNKKNTIVIMRIYNQNKKYVAQVKKKISKSGNVTLTWKGRTAKANKAKLAGGKVVPNGKYNIRIIIKYGNTSKMGRKFTVTVKK